MATEGKITGDTVRADFNAIEAVIHYTRAAHRLGLWGSERRVIEQTFPDRSAPLLEAGCGAGRVALGLRALGFSSITAFDFAPEMIEQARSLATERGVDGITFALADAVELAADPQFPDGHFAGALFLFNGLGQIPGRERRRSALRGLHAKCRSGACLVFTTHDRDDDPVERVRWELEARLWADGAQDSRLVEFGDRYFVHEHGRTFMHLPDRREVLEDLAATGWTPEADAMRDALARERRAVREFSDNCRFWVARKN